MIFKLTYLVKVSLRQITVLSLEVSVDTTPASKFKFKTVDEASDGFDNC